MVLVGGNLAPRAFEHHCHIFSPGSSIRSVKKGMIIKKLAKSKLSLPYILIGNWFHTEIVLVLKLDMKKTQQKYLQMFWKLTKQFAPMSCNHSYCKTFQVNININKNFTLRLQWSDFYCRWWIGELHIENLFGLGLPVTKNFCVSFFKNMRNINP